MKKFVSFLIVLILLVGMIPAAFAAGSAYWSGPDVVRPGDTITLTFCAGGGIYGGSGSVSFDSSVLTLKSYTQTIGGSWAVEFSGNNFVFYDNSMSSPITGSSAIFKAVFAVSANAPVGETLTVSATGVTVSDGQADTVLGSTSYSTTIARPLSGNCDLAELNVTGADINPAFSPSTTTYTASVPYSVSSIDVSAVAAHEGATVEISNPTLTAGTITNVSITVTAENGATKSYRIQVNRAQDPNYVKSNNANLRELSVDGYTLSPAFSSDVTQYYVWLPYEVDFITLQAKTESAKAIHNIGQCDQLIAGVGNDIAVTVTAEDGTQQVYTITAVRAPAHEDVEAFLAGNRAESEPEVTEPAEPEPEVTEPVTEPAPQPTEPAPEVPATNTTSSSNFTWILFVAGCVLGAGITALLFVLLRRRKY